MFNACLINMLLKQCPADQMWQCCKIYVLCFFFFADCLCHHTIFDIYGGCDVTTSMEDYTDKEYSYEVRANTFPLQWFFFICPIITTLTCIYVYGPVNVICVCWQQMNIVETNLLISFLYESDICLVLSLFIKKKNERLWLVYSITLTLGVCWTYPMSGWMVIMYFFTLTSFINSVSIFMYMHECGSPLFF